MKNKYYLLVIFFFVFSFFMKQNTLAVFEYLDPEIKAPKNEPAVINLDGNKLIISYNGQPVFQAEIENTDEYTEFKNIIDDQDGVINQVLKFTSRKNPLVLSGVVTASHEAFPCESDRKRTGPDVVRHSVGLSHSLLNRAVYDRMYDWVL